MQEDSHKVAGFCILWAISYQNPTLVNPTLVFLYFIVTPSKIQSEVVVDSREPGGMRRFKTKQTENSTNYDGHKMVKIHAQG